MLSIIIPFYNEKESLVQLHKELTDALGSMQYELIFIDDGSIDGGKEVLQNLSKTDSHILFTSFARRSGKGYALDKGVHMSKGERIMFMDADLQDDPKDIPHFLKKMDDGYDLVNGVRTKRKDSSVIKFYSKMGNGFLKKFLHSPFTDINCGFKLFKREMLDEIPLYSNNFRFLPVAAYYKGFQVTEIPVNNRPRKHGSSKFGITKSYVGFIDTITAYFLYQFAERPLHFFGTIGGIFFAFGFIVAAYLLYERIFQGVLLYRRPGLQFAIVFIVIGIQIIMTGFIGELIVYINKRNQKSE